MSTGRWTARLAAILVVALGMMLAQSRGVSREEGPVYARVEVDGLTEFAIGAGSRLPSLRLFPAEVPLTEEGFVQSLKHRRVIALWEGSETYVLEAVARQKLDELVADRVEAMRAELEAANELANELAQLRNERARKEEEVGSLAQRFEREAAEDAGRAAGTLAEAAKAAQEQVEAAGRISELEVRQIQRHVQYETKRLQLAATLNTASAPSELRLLKRMDPEALQRAVVDTLARETEAAFKRVEELDAELQLEQEKLTELLLSPFSSFAQVDAEGMLRAVASGAGGALQTALNDPPAARRLLRQAVAVACTSAELKQRASLAEALNRTLSAAREDGVQPEVLAKVVVSPRSFREVRSIDGRLARIAHAAEGWELGSWSVFLRSLAASFALADGGTTRVPPPRGVFSGPELMRLAPNEVPAFLTAAEALPEGSVSRIAELLEVVQQEYSKAADTGSEAETFWRFALYYLQQRAKRDLAERSGG